MIKTIFISAATEILGKDSTTPMTGREIAKLCSDYAYDYDVEIPYSTQALIGAHAQNKREAFRENLLKFAPEQQFEIIKKACERPQFVEDLKVLDLKAKLFLRYGEYNTTDDNLVLELIDDTNNWLGDYTNVYRVFNDGMVKLKNSLFQRNMLDDFRLALELLIKSILGNHKTLENQKEDLGTFLKENGDSVEVRKLFTTVLSHFASFQNGHVKHHADDGVAQGEAILIVDLCSSLMKHLVKLNAKSEEANDPLSILDL